MFKDCVKLRRVTLVLLVINILLALILLSIAFNMSQKRLTFLPYAEIVGANIPIEQYQPEATAVNTAVALVLPSPIPTKITIPPTPTPEPTSTPTAVVTRIGIEHTVREGEDLWSIAKRYYGSGLAWMTVIDANPQYDTQEGVEAGDLVFIPRPIGGMPNYILTPVPEAIPIRASSYTLKPNGLSDEQNVNCNDDCSNLALTAFDPAFYGRAAACPPEWLGTNKTGKLTISGLGVFYCLDAGTLIQFTCREVSGYGDQPICLYEVDFLCETFPPPFHGQLFYEWTVEWVPLGTAIMEAKTGQRYCN